MKLGRRDFIGGVAAACALSAFGIPASGRIARIGHMTDTHVVGKIESLARVRMALELFKAKGVEMVINNGDIADRHIPEAYRLYRKVTNEVFPEAAMRPREVFAYAWHDQCAHHTWPSSTAMPRKESETGLPLRVKMRRPFLRPSKRRALRELSPAMPMRTKERKQRLSVVAMVMVASAGQL